MPKIIMLLKHMYVHNRSLPYIVPAPGWFGLLIISAYSRTLPVWAGKH